MRTILVVDLASDTVSERPDDTRTLDVSEGLRPAHSGRIVRRELARELRIGGRQGNLHRAFTSPLSSRVGGEECLVASRAFRATLAHPGSHRLSAVKPTLG